jgi:hypothetical protein
MPKLLYNLGGSYLTIGSIASFCLGHLCKIRPRKVADSGVCLCPNRIRRRSIVPRHRAERQSHSASLPDVCCYQSALVHAFQYGVPQPRGSSGYVSHVTSPDCRFEHRVANRHLFAVVLPSVLFQHSVFSVVRLLLQSTLRSWTTYSWSIYQIESVKLLPVRISIRTI